MAFSIRRSCREGLTLKSIHLHHLCACSGCNRHSERPSPPAHLPPDCQVGSDALQGIFPQNVEYLSEHMPAPGLGAARARAAPPVASTALLTQGQTLVPQDLSHAVVSPELVVPKVPVAAVLPAAAGSLKAMGKMCKQAGKAQDTT